MTSTAYIILGVVAIILSIILFVIGLKENESSFVYITGSLIVIAVLLFGLSGGNEEREGKVLQVLVTQDSCVQSLNEEGELVFVPTYCYLIVFEADDGEYRTMISELGEDWSHYKEGEMIIYTLGSTFEIEEGK